MHPRRWPGLSSLDEPFQAGQRTGIFDDLFGMFGMIAMMMIDEGFDIIDSDSLRSSND